MKLTNKYNLPDSLLRAVQNDPYESGKSDYSVTQLIDTPQRVQLKNKFKDSIVDDISNRMWVLLGQSVHTILERAGSSEKVEERLFLDIEGVTISGQYDRLDLSNKTLQDYKVTTTYKSNGDDSWEKQLNILRYLALQNKYEVEKLEIVAIFRDWSRAKTKSKYYDDYPESVVKVINVPVWSEEKTLQYIKERVKKHKEAKEGKYIPCSDEERWKRKDVYALKKKVSFVFFSNACLTTSMLSSKFAKLT